MTKPKFHTHIGGQAVLEGVMMRGRDRYVIAVRKPNNEIVVDERPVPSLAKRYPFLRWPIIRGTLAMIEAMVLAVQAISFSAKESVDEDIEITPREMGLAITLGFVMAIGLFFVFPVWLTKFINGRLLLPTDTISWGQNVTLNLVEGTIRISLFLGYLYLVSRLKDIQRVFQYHGAEHKTIHAYEHGEELITESVAKFGTEHMRCGTSFLLIVMIVSILVFTFLGRPTSILTRIGLRLIVLPLVAGLSYEVIKFAGRHEGSKFVKIIMSPGLFLQRLTTREPSKDQLEVAIYSLKKLLALEGETKEIGEQAVSAVKSKE